MEVRDEGLLASAIVRPQTTVFGEDAYPSIWDKAVAEGRIAEVPDAAAVLRAWAQDPPH